MMSKFDLRAAVEEFCQRISQHIDMATHQLEIDPDNAWVCGHRSALGAAFDHLTELYQKADIQPPEGQSESILHAIKTPLYAHLSTGRIQGSSTRVLVEHGSSQVTVEMGLHSFTVQSKSAYCLGRHLTIAAGVAAKEIE